MHHAHQQSVPEAVVPHVPGAELQEISAPGFWYSKEVIFSNEFNDSGELPDRSRLLTSRVIRQGSSDTSSS